MKVLFAVSNDKMSESIVRQYQKEYKQIISYKNVYYFNAILKELQRDKGYDRIVISEDLEQYVNNDYEQMDKFLFDRLDSISDEASDLNGEDIPIILICTERRTKAEPILVKLFGIGIYNAIIGNDRSVNEVCRLINRPRTKKEAKMYYKIDSGDVDYNPEDENDVSELELQNILAHYKRLGNDEDRYVESFDSIASQYNDTQLKIISKCLPLNVRAVLEERSPKYQQVNAYTTKISDSVRYNNKNKQQKAGTSEILLKNSKGKVLNEPVVVPSSIGVNKKKIATRKIETVKVEKEPEYEEEPEEEFEMEESLPGVPPISELTGEEESITLPSVEEPEEVEEPVKKRRGRPRKIVEEPVEQAPKRKRGRPRKNPEPEVEETFLPGIDEYEEETTLPGINSTEEIKMPQYEEEKEVSLPVPEEDDNEIEEQYTNVLRNLQEENNNNDEELFSSLQRPKKEETRYPELNMDEILTPGKKMVAFLGTSKNGTSFLVNNVAELLSSNGIDTAILDLTSNRSSYYIYTKNEEELRNKSNYIMRNLKEGKASGIQEHRNLTIYTSGIENEEELQDVEPIVETLVRNHTIVLLDCDFTTPSRYFKYAQEIYLVQSMDILTIQPLTAFLNQLTYKNAFDESKVRVVLNKFMRTREITEEILVGGISIYNDASMTVRKELFNRRTVKYITIPFELKTYLRYLDGLVTCDVSLKGYSKEFMQSLKRLASMIYQGGTVKANDKYMPPSVKNNSNFSASMDRTLNRMKGNY